MVRLMWMLWEPDYAFNFCNWTLFEAEIVFLLSKVHGDGPLSKRKHLHMWCRGLWIDLLTIWLIFKEKHAISMLIRRVRLTRKMLLRRRKVRTAHRRRKASGDPAGKCLFFCQPGLFLTANVTLFSISQGQTFEGNHFVLWSDIIELDLYCIVFLFDRAGTREVHNKLEKNR